ncbi:MAG: imidazoleglycerol-phosphate dehydratase HisB [Planctomycetes bacterium]|nr:imidazoleglycerol-phosphate dehydratase HisB [Planctomycetota bacterium]
MRISNIPRRKTKETDIEIKLNLDKSDDLKIHTGHGFFNHMLESFAKHGRFGLEVIAKGDDTGPHHLVEDVGIVLGQSLLDAAGDKEGIERFANLSMPMDETLIDVAIDFGGRGYLVFDAPEVQDQETGLGIHLTNDFFYALCINGKFNLHIKVVYGTNPHHIIEGMFKGTAIALRKALEITNTGIPSTKGVL